MGKLEITGVPLSNNSAGAAQQPTQWLYWTASRCDCVSGNRVFQSERVKLPLINKGFNVPLSTLF